MKTSSPKIASTIVGVPATISTPDSTARASAAGRPYSLSQTAVATPIGNAISVPSAVSIRVPMIGSLKPPPVLSASVSVVEPTMGDSPMASMFTYWMPRTSM